MIFWAHSDSLGRNPEEQGSNWQLLSVHLANVSEFAETFARGAAPNLTTLQAMARMAGLLHDYGKYTDCFQSMIRGKRTRCPHSIHGAMAVRLFVPEKQLPRNWAMPVVRAIAAHHAGLQNEHEIDPKTRPGRVAPDVERLRNDALAIRARAEHDQPSISNALATIESCGPIASHDLFTRILLSCLVDADRLDSAGRMNQQIPLKADLKLRLLTAHLDGLSREARQRGANQVVLKIREQVQELCRVGASGSARLLSLTVPTGGGKTLAAMRFALERAAANPDEVRRIIVVIPFLSIIEQNAKVYREIFGPDSLLEHHSGAVAGELPGKALSQEPDNTADEARKRLETENWDAPLIVTTSVRFFESLFSNHPSDLRRIHNIARSIIILDEVQTLPRSLLAPLLGMLHELTRDWGCTVVMATATQPAFEVSAESTEEPGCRWPHGTVTPIVPQEAAARMHTALRRVNIEWRLEAATSWAALATELLEYRQALCVVNVLEDARHLFAIIRDQAGKGKDAGIFHLSTRMCAEHRLALLALVRDCLENDKRCLVISTQLIEAGVDVDFPIAYRALGPLDAIVQVAGRVDREGRLTAKAGRPAGRLVVFRTEDEKTPPYGYKEATGITETLARLRGADEGIQVDDLLVLQNFFERYYDTSDTALGIPLAEMRADDKLCFADLAREFEMINSRTRDVFVPYGAGAGLIDELRSSLANGCQMDFNLLRKLQRYTVGLQPWVFEKYKNQTLIEVVSGKDLWTCIPAAYMKDGEGLVGTLAPDNFVF